MTWHFDPSGTTMDVYDHTGSQVRTDHAFSGSWSDFPDEMLAVMQAEAEAALDANNLERTLRIVAQAAFEDIEEGTP